MQKRVVFRNRWLGVALVVPQLLLIFTFFYWPAGEALYWAFTLQRPWGGGNEWVGFANFHDMLVDPVYWNSVLRSLVFALVSNPRIPTDRNREKTERHNPLVLARQRAFVRLDNDSGQDQIGFFTAFRRD